MFKSRNSDSRQRQDEITMSLLDMKTTKYIKKEIDIRIKQRSNKQLTISSIVGSGGKSTGMLNYK